MNNTVFLRVNGRDWGGWTSVRISAGIDRIARDFNVSITRQWPGGEDVPPVKNGDAVEVLIGDDLVITGWVEALPLRYDAQTIMTGIVGRSKTADLIDCSASPAQHNGKNLFLIASALARPFGVDVVDAGAPASTTSPPDGRASALAIRNKFFPFCCAGGAEQAIRSAVLLRPTMPVIMVCAS